MPSLASDIVGRVKRLPLKPSAGSALMPLFEATSNALHAIQDHWLDDVGKKGRIDIEVLRSDDEAAGYPVTGFIVEDNGVGFTNENYESFLKPDSQHKLNRGGKGVGRLGWLKVFNKINVDSAYSDGGALGRRHFDFVLTPTDQVVPKKVATPFAAPGTRVRLVGFEPLYGGKCPNRWQTIVDHLIGHFLPVLITDQAPQIRYKDGDEDIDLRQQFNDEVLDQSESKFSVKLDDGEFVELSMRHVKAKKAIRGSQSGYHRCYLAANDRAVEDFSVDDLLGLKLLDGEAIYLGCATAEFFNDHVNQERTRFTFDASDHAAIRRALAASARDYLYPYVQEALDAKERTAVDVINENPQFLYLRGGVRDFVAQKVQANLTGREDILVAMARDRYRRQNTFKAVEKEIATATQLNDAVSAKIEEYQRFVQDQQRGALAEYVLKRKSVLDLLDKLSGYDDPDAERHHREDAIHTLICPMRTDSGQLVDIQDHNLWILDDRLAFFNFFASDRQMKTYVEGGTTDRPDLAFFYDACFAWRGTEESPNTIVLVEFKRPGREDYKNESPLQQVLRYVDLFKSSGTLKDNQGRVISAAVRQANFQCYIVADLTAGLNAAMIGHGNPTPDGEGLFGYTDRPQVFFEIIPFAKLIRDAKARNAIFFQKLGLNDHGRA